MSRRLAVVTLVAVALSAAIPPALAGAGEQRVHRRVAAPPVKLLPPLPPSQLFTQHGKPVAPAPFFRSGFIFKADGYKIGVSTFGSAVFLEVWRGRNGQRTQTAYMARGVARPERLGPPSASSAR